MPQRPRCAPARTYLTRPKTRVLNPFHKRHSRRVAQRSDCGDRPSIRARPSVRAAKLDHPAAESIRCCGHPGGGRVDLDEPGDTPQSRTLPAPVRWKCGPAGLRLGGLERVNCRPTRAPRGPLRRTPLSSTTALSRRIHSARNRRVLLNLTVVPVLGLVLAFSACGSSSSNSSDTPSSSPTTSSTGSKYQGRLLLAGDPVGPAGRCDHAGVHLRKGRRHRVGGCAC